MSEVRQPETASAASRARQLGAQAHQLGTRGDWIGALEPARQGVEQWRALAKQDATRFLPELARSLLTLSFYFSKAELRHEAFSAASESVTHWRQLAADNFDRFGLELAHALQRLGPHTDRRRFMSLYEEATNLLVRLAARNPALLPEAAAAASRATDHFIARAERQKALEYSRLAVELWRVLAAKDVVQFGGGLIQALRRLAIEISQTSVDDEGLRREARRIAASRIFFLVVRSLRPKAIASVFTAATTGKVLGARRSAPRRRN